MNQEYFDKVTELEKMNASDQYILGWQEGYQDAPEVEEQRVTDAYQAGYEAVSYTHLTLPTKA